MRVCGNWPRECTVIGHPLGYVARRGNRLHPFNGLERIEGNQHTEMTLIAMDLMEDHFLMLNAHIDNP